MTLEDNVDHHCATLKCPEKRILSGTYCRKCALVRLTNYRVLVAGTGYIKIVETENGIERQVIHKQ